MFASDYPHHRDSDDPIARFERTMDGIGESVRQKFYTDNFTKPSLGLVFSHNDTGSDARVGSAIWA